MGAEGLIFNLHTCMASPLSTKLSPKCQSNLITTTVWKWSSINSLFSSEKKVKASEVLWSSYADVNQCQTLPTKPGFDWAPREDTESLGHTPPAPTHTLLPQLEFHSGKKAQKWRWWRMRLAGGIKCSTHRMEWDALDSIVPCGPSRKEDMNSF